MIKINILPQREIKRREKKLEISYGKEFLLSFILPIGLTFILLLSIYAYIEIKKHGLKQDIDKNRRILEELQIKKAEMEKFERMNRDLKKKSEVIEEIRRMQNIPVIMLSLLARKLPEGVWLTKLNYDNKNISIEGLAFSNFNIVSFVDNLKSSSEIQDVTLVESQQTEYQKTIVYRFLIKFTFKG